MSTLASPALHTRDAAAPARAGGLAGEIVPGAAWDATVAEFDEVCQEQLAAFAAERWPATRREPVLFRREGEIVGGTLVLIQPLPLGLGAIAVTKWGPMLRRAEAPDADAVHAGMIEALIADYAERRGMMLSVLPRADTGPVNRRYEHLIARGFRPGSVLPFPNRYIVNLGIDAAAQRRSLEQKWRYHLNKSEKAGLAFEPAGIERMGEFHALYGAMTSRKQFQDHSAYDGIDTLMRIEPAALRPRLFFVRHGAEVVAGAIIFVAGDRAVYLYGATNETALPLRAGYFMHWHIIGWLRENTRARWYDLGGTDGYQGLHQFKKGMVGEAGAIRPVPPVANHAASPMTYALGAGAFGARDAWHALKRRLAAWRNPRARPDQRRGL